MTTEPKAEGVVTIGCDDPQCGCKEPAFTEPMEALRFLSGRMKFAGIGEAVAKSYARDIDAILARHQTPTPSAVEALARAASRAEVSFNTVGGCYERNPRNFMVAMKALDDDVKPLRELLRSPEIAALLKETK